MEVTGVWWLPWSSKPVTRRYRRVVGSIPIRLRQPHDAAQLMDTLRNLRIAVTDKERSDHGEYTKFRAH